MAHVAMNQGAYTSTHMFLLHPCGQLLMCDVQICLNCAFKFHALLFNLLGTDYERIWAMKGALEVILTSELREFYLMASEEVLSLEVCSLWLGVG